MKEKIKSTLKSLVGNYDMSGRYAKKYNLFYIVVLGMISAFEIYMIVSCIASGFTFPRHDVWVYFGCYVGLLLACLATITILILDRKKQLSVRFLSHSTNVFITIITIWASIITILDSTVGHYPVVYLTIIITIGGVIVVNPIIYVALTVLTDVATLVGINNFGGGSVLTGGDNLNLIIFIVMGIFIAFRNFFVSVSEYKAMNALKKVSHTDILTGISNSTAYFELIDKLSKDSNGGKGYILFLMDVNGLKQTNDHLGHHFGSELLVQAAKELKVIFENDRLYRVGGDEFVAVITDNFDSASYKATQVDEILFNHPIEFEGKRFALSVACGHAAWNEGETFNEVFQRADSMMYEKKKVMKTELTFGVELPN
ncbi:MAG: GGDEF domain-containing protein [Bacilli bacterium]|nr:GGDEF domain-containing protein [Bacilli bacterium]